MDGARIFCLTQIKMNAINYKSEKRNKLVDVREISSNIYMRIGLEAEICKDP